MRNTNGNDGSITQGRTDSMKSPGDPTDQHRSTSVLQGFNIHRLLINVCAQDTMISDVEYVELRLALADVRQTLDRVMKGRGMDQ